MKKRTVKNEGDVVLWDKESDQVVRESDGKHVKALYIATLWEPVRDAARNEQVVRWAKRHICRYVMIVRVVIVFATIDEDVAG